MLGKYKDEDSKVIRVTESYKDEAKEAKRSRMDRNKENFDIYHLNQDYGHKDDGQSQEFLPKQSMAVEQFASFIHQGLLDYSDWYKVDTAPGVVNPLLTPDEVMYLMNRQLEKCDFSSVIHDSLKLGTLGSLMIVKVHGNYVDKPIYFVEENLDKKTNKFKKTLIKDTKKAWQLQLSLVRHEDFYPDPTGRGLYVLQDIEMDISDLYALADLEEPVYDKSVLDKLGASLYGEDEEQKFNKSRETGQDVAESKYRKRVKVTEGWGTIIDPDTGKVMHSNCTWTIANDRYLIRKPTPNPFWHQKLPYVVSPIIRTPNAVWPKALADAPTRLNIAQNELFNLILDGGMMSVYGIKQARPDWMEDVSQLRDGIQPGDTIEVNSVCPPGAKVVERVDTSSVPAEALSVFNLTNSAFNESAMTNDLRLGVMPSRAVKATEVVEASNTITSMFTGIARIIESSFIQNLLELSWAVVAQHEDDLDSKEVQDLLGPQRALMLSGVSPEERFAGTVEGYKFKVYGLTQTLKKAGDFKKLTALLQTIAGSEILVEKFAEKYDFGRLLEQIMKSLDINTDKIKLDETELIANQMFAAQAAQGAPVQGGPDMQSQIRQATTGPANDIFEGSRMPQANFPPSRATPRQ